MPDSCVACSQQAGHCLQAQVRPDQLSLTMRRPWSLLAMWVHFLAALPSMRLQQGKTHQSGSAEVAACKAISV
jgi:hypothetical protein